ncbi:MAG: multidrug efflux SMR transporter [Bacteriovorax sp.]|jgi:quaternary ammonium compound-resistance protein SugE
MNSSTLNWILLIVAGIFEVVWAIFLKNSKGFTQIIPTALFGLTLFISMWLLSTSLRTIPLSVAYPVWTGIGAVGSVLVGVMLFGESASVPKLLFVSLILIGVIGLKVVGD